MTEPPLTLRKRLTALRKRMLELINLLPLDLPTSNSLSQRDALSLRREESLPARDVEPLPYQAPNRLQLGTLGEAEDPPLCES